jgi:ribosome-binding factor A
MTSKRQKRVAEQIREVLSELFTFEVDDPRLSGLTVMEVQIDRELMYADVFVSSLDGDEVRDEVMEGLESASGFLRRELGSRVRLQRTPELRFQWDETLAYGEQIDRVLDSLTIPPPETEDGDDGAR